MIDGLTEARLTAFWNKVEKWDGPDGCWLWVGTRNQDGYGRFKVGGRKESAHRLSWMVANNQTVPAGLEVCHRCDVRNCVRPDHLFLGTHLDNMRDCSAKGRLPGSHGDRNGHATKPERTPRGSVFPQSKINETQVRDIRRRAALGNVTLVDLGREYGVSAVLVGRIVRNKAWRHVRDE